LAVNLRQLRESRKLTQDKVAELGFVNQATVSQLELGKIFDPRHSTLKALADVYGVEVQDVVDALNVSIQEAEGA
jgi:transcriptional regulator with XRE-family HTH domain